MNQELAKQFGTKSDQGVVVANVQAKTPAADAGVKAGDVIMDFAGKKVSNPSDLQEIVERCPVGSKQSLVVLRDGKSTKLNVTLREQPANYGLAEGGSERRRKRRPALWQAGSRRGSFDRRSGPKVGRGGKWRRSHHQCPSRQPSPNGGARKRRCDCQRQSEARKSWPISTRPWRRRRWRKVFSCWCERPAARDLSWSRDRSSTDRHSAQEDWGHNFPRKAVGARATLLPPLSRWRAILAVSGEPLKAWRALKRSSMVGGRKPKNR